MTGKLRLRSLTWRVLVLLMEGLAALAAGLLLAIGLLLWRVSHGPLVLTSLAPYIERALNRPDAPLRVGVGETALTWLGGRSSLGVLARDVALRRAGAPPDSEALATLPAISVSFSLGALLRGTLEPAHIDLQGGSLALVRDAAGVLTLGGRPLDRLFASDRGEQNGSTAGTSDPRWSLQSLLVPERGDDPLASLALVTATDLHVELDDREGGRRATATIDDLLVYRGPQGVSASARLNIRIEGRTIALGLRLGYGAATHLAEVALALDHLDLSALPDWTVFGAMRGLHSRISGTLRGALDLSTGLPGPAGVDLSGEPGRADFTVLANGSLPLDGFHLQLSYDPGLKRLTGQDVSADLGPQPGPGDSRDGKPGPKLRASFVVDGVDPREFRLPAATSPAAGSAVSQRWTIVGDAHLDGLLMDRLGAYWPAALAPDARAWVVPNVTFGRLDALSAHVRLTVDPGSPATPSLDQLAGSYRFQGLKVSYFRPLPAAEGIDGSATFNQNRMDLNASAGQVRGIRITSGRVALTQFQAPMQNISIDVDLASAIRDQLELVDMKPLGFLHRLGQSPSSYGGQVQTHLSLAFPLRRELRTDAIDVKAAAELHQLSVARAALDRDLSGGEAHLTLDTHSLSIEGTAQLAGVPAEVEWVQNFSSAAAVQARYHAVARLDAVQRQALGLEVVPDRLQGVLGVDLSYAELAGGQSRLRAELDLADVALSLQEAGWSKGRSVPGKATISAGFVRGRLTTLDGVTLEAPALSLAGSATFAAAGGSLSALRFTKLVLGQTRLSGSVLRGPSGGWQLSASGPVLDVGALLGAGADASGGKSSEPRAERPPLAVALEADRLILGARREMRQVALDGLLDGSGVERLRAQGRVDAPAPGIKDARVSAFVRLQLADHRFNIETSNLGITLRGLDLGTYIHGGRATAVGQTRELDGRQSWSGTAYCGPFAIVGAGTLARLLSLASLSGIANLLNGSGIPFDRFETGFTVVQDRITLTDARAYGGAIGINVSGAIDRMRDGLDLSGTLVPAYTLNSSLGSLPVIGPLLLGGEGAGLFAANFRLSGPAGDPRITVNPLSVLAPGFLRGLFIFGAPGRRGSAPARGD